MKQGVPVVLVGDDNVAPTEIDIYPTSSWDDDALRAAGEPAGVRKAGCPGLDRCDPLLHPEERIYTFWHYLGITGSATPAFASIISCSAPRSLRG